MATTEDFEEKQADITIPKTIYSQETNMIQQSVSLFVEVMDSLSSDEEVKQNELLKEIYSGQFKTMKEKITLLINNCHDNGDLLAHLLDLHDWMDGVLAQYKKRVGSVDAPINKNTNTKGKAPMPEVKASTESGSSYDGSDSDDEAASDSGESSDGGGRLESRRARPMHAPQDKGKGRAAETTATATTTTTTTTVAVSTGQVDLGPLSESNPLPPLKAGYKPAEGPGECPICCEDAVPASELFIFAECSHQYCRECLQGYFNNCINDGKVLDITCPAPGCTSAVEYHHVRGVVTEEIFNKYEEFAFIAALNADPSVKWCPKPGCGNALIGDPDNPRCQCTSPECRYEFCFLCSEPWHADATCDEYQQWKVDNGLTDSKFSNWAKKNTKKCPKCKTMIEKIAGCNHMTCTNCRFEFCWLCGGKYTSNHFDVFNVLGCPGMQSGSKQFGIARRLGMRALIGTGIVLGGIIGTALAIPAAVVAGPIYGGYKLHQRRKRNSRRRRHYM
jgi:hypothetical protein